MTGLDIGLVVALITALGGLVTAVAALRRTRVDGTAAVTEAAVSLVGPLTTRLDELEKHEAANRLEIETLRTSLTARDARIAHLELAVEKLRILLQENGIDATPILDEIPRF